MEASLSRKSFWDGVGKKLEKVSGDEIFDIISLGLNHDFIYNIGVLRGICKDGGIYSQRYKGEKIKLPFFYGTCTREYHSADSVPEPNGIIHLDYDFKDSISDIGISMLKDKLRSCQYIRLMYTSPSGKGLKIFVQTDSYSESGYIDASRKLARYYAIKYNLGLEFFDSIITMRHVSFLSYDPDSYYNKNSKTFFVYSNHEEVSGLSKKLTFRSISDGRVL